jgi:hypothetical protein
MCDPVWVLEKVPLTTFLSWVWIAHTIEADNAFEAAASAQARRPFRMSLPMWTNGLRFLSEDGVTVSELRSLARADCNLGGIERWGWALVGDAVEGGERRPGFGSFRGIKGNTVLRPTSAGSEARRLWPLVLGEVEQRWRTRFGGEAVDTLRDALLARAAATPMPWSPPEVATTDGYYSHVVAAHPDADDDGQRPLVALLGEVLTAYTLEHEAGAAVSLPLGANVLRVVGSDSIPLRDLPALTGLSKEGTTQTAGHLERRGLATSTPDRTISLSPSGLDALDDYRRRAGQPEDSRLHEALAAFVTKPDALSAGLVPPEGCWRGERPYLNRTNRLLANPTAALPWHPLVLGRGAWPDAS